MMKTMRIIKMSEARGLGTEALAKALGPVGMARYLEEYDNGGQGDYTKEKYEEPDDSIEDILAMVNENCKTGEEKRVIIARASRKMNLK